MKSTPLRRYRQDRCPSSSSPTPGFFVEPPVHHPLLPNPQPHVLPRHCSLCLRLRLLLSPSPPLHHPFAQRVRCLFVRALYYRLRSIELLAHDATGFIPPLLLPTAYDHPPPLSALSSFRPERQLLVILSTSSRLYTSVAWASSSSSTATQPTPASTHLNLTNHRHVTLGQPKPATCMRR